MLCKGRVFSLSLALFLQTFFFSFILHFVALDIFPDSNAAKCVREREGGDKGKEKKNCRGNIKIFFTLITCEQP